jgi:ubiquitin thioesterase OTU1
MFSSIALVLEQDMSQAPKIRKSKPCHPAAQSSAHHGTPVVADAIRSDPVTWNEAILGRPPAAYISTILSPNSWGGAIELAILASHYDTEVASVDVETGRVDRFEPRSASSSGRVLLVYSGIHYDAAVLAPEPGAPVAFCASVFPAARNGVQDAILLALQELAGKLRKKHKFTNTATFDLKCEVRERASGGRVRTC